MKKALFVLFVLLLPVMAFAQVPVEVDDPSEVSEAYFSGHFWIAVFAGLVLAIAFQLLFTGLSVALGLSAFNIKREDPRTRHRRERERERQERHESRLQPILRERERQGEEAKHDDDDEGFHPTVRKITTGMGLFWLFSTAISAFFAAWMAVELAVVATTTTGLILGLTIWGLFFISLALFEVTAGLSMVGSTIGLLVGGVKSAYEGVTSGVSSMFGKSRADEAGDMAQTITRKVREELEDAFDDNDLKGIISGYVDKLKSPDPKDIRKELERLLDKTELRAVIDNDRMLDHEEISASLGIKQNPMAQQQTQKVVNRIKNVISSMREEGSMGGNGEQRVDRVTDSAMQAMGMSPQDAEQVRNKVTDFLRSTNKESLNPEGIKRDLGKLFESPREGISALGHRLAGIDRQTIADIVAQRTDMSREEARQKTDMIYGTITRIIGEVRPQPTASQPQTGTTTGVAPGMTNRIAGQFDSTTESAKRKIAMTVKGYLDSVDRPELNYEGIKRDFSKLFRDPKAGSEAIYNRLKRMDRDSIKALVASMPNMDEHDADRMVENIEQARDEAITKYEQIRDEVNRRIESAKDEAYHQAEETRKDASTLAWWMVTNAFVSGVAAAIGGMLGATL